MKRRDFLGVVSGAGLAAGWPSRTSVPHSTSLAREGSGANAVRKPYGEVLIANDLRTAPPEGSKPEGGSWKIQDGRMVQTRVGSASLLVMGQPDWNDYTAAVSTRLVAQAKGTEAGFALHIGPPGNYVVFSLHVKKGGLFAVLRIQRDADMEFYVNAPYLPSVRRNTLIGDQCRLDADPRSWHELRVDVHGTEFYGYVDGRHVADFDFNAQPAPWYAHKEPRWASNPVRGQFGLVSNGWPAEFRQLEVRRLVDFSHIATSVSGRRDAAGRLLPRRSYAETMTRNTEWVINCEKVVETDMAPPSIQHLPPHVLAIWVSTDNQRLNYDVGEYAFNAGTFLSGGVQYYLYSGDSRILRRAEELAEWGLANSTPADWEMPYLAPSIVQWLPDGNWQGMPDDWGLEPDKSAYFGDALLRLYAVTGKGNYLAATRRIAGTLMKLRQPDGSWPFRIIARTGHINFKYTHSQLWYIRFFERLARLTGERKWTDVRDAAFRWMMENPVKTNHWEGLYGDYTAGAKSLDQWVPLEFAQYLVDHRLENPAYLDVAVGILDWVYQNMVIPSALHAGVPGVVEQTGYNVVLAHHELRLAQTHAVLWGATHDPKHRQAALEIANSVTWLAMSDGKLRMAHWHHASDCYMRCLTFNDQFMRIMAEIPETAPHDENHLLQSSTEVTRIQYGDDCILYETVDGGSEVLALRSSPRLLTAGGTELPKKRRPGSQEGWHYDNETHLLKIEHAPGQVGILL